MATDNVEVSSSVGLDGNSYTTAISNDKLTNEDFLKLMLEELKMQDPTKPMDSQQMLDSQMQMSNIETNLTLAASMETLTAAFTQSALSNASNLIGQSIEDGNINEAGINKAYTVRSVSSDGEGGITVTAQEILYLEDIMVDSEGNLIDYNTAGEILDSEGNTTGQKVVIGYPGQIDLDEDGKPIILDADNEVVADSTYVLSGQTRAVYSDQLSEIPFSAITRVF
jgi:flagellar basal-body rod modification protein FlgD